MHTYCTLGAAEYSASYISKQDEADVKQLRNLVIRKFSQLLLTGRNDLRSRTKAVAAAVLASYKVGSVQACYKLLGLKHVISSRNVLPIRSVKRAEMAVGINMQCVPGVDGVWRGTDKEANVLHLGVGTHLGKRDAYAKLVAQQKILQPDRPVEITLHSLITAFDMKPDTKDNRGKTAIAEPEFFTLHPNTCTYLIVTF